MGAVQRARASKVRIINSTYGAQLHKMYSRFFMAPCGRTIALHPFIVPKREVELICNCFLGFASGLLRRRDLLDCARF